MHTFDTTEHKYYRINVWLAKFIVAHSYIFFWILFLYIVSLYSRIYDYKLLLPVIGKGRRDANKQSRNL